MADLHFGKTVRIRFSSLRNGVGDRLGVVCDIDTMVERNAYKVKDGDGWKWQIKALNQIKKYDGAVETDQECLNNCELEDVEILQN